VGNWEGICRAWIASLPSECEPGAIPEKCEAVKNQELRKNKELEQMERFNNRNLCSRRRGDSLSSHLVCYVQVMPTPLGDMLAICDDERLHLLEFCDLADLSKKIKKLQQKIRADFHFIPCSFTPSSSHVSSSPHVSPICARVQSALAGYFAGRAASFSIPCALHGSDFSIAVWRALQQIPVGESWSYAKQAAFIGRPTACRAVARANSRNQIAVIIPCHRVIGSDGRLTGYAGGLARKEWLLAHEKRYFPA